MMKNYRRFTYLLLVMIAGLSLIGAVPVEAQSPKPVVVVDPAHGGEDFGAVGIDKVAEKDITLVLAKRLQQELQRGGACEVILTRDTDQTVSVEQRRQRIEALKPAIVLSLHANAGFGKVASGFELYYPGLGATTSSSSKTISKVEAASVKLLNDTVKFAHLLRKNLDAVFPRQGRGLREADLVLMEGLNVPVVSVEIGFLTTPDEKKKLSDEKIRTRIVRALADAVEAYFR